jgi:hypothetical protein
LPPLGAAAPNVLRRLRTHASRTQKNKKHQGKDVPLARLWQSKPHQEALDARTLGADAELLVEGTDADANHLKVLLTNGAAGVALNGALLFGGDDAFARRARVNVARTCAGVVFFLRPVIKSLCAHTPQTTTNPPTNTKKPTGKKLARNHWAQVKPGDLLVVGDTEFRVLRGTFAHA